MQYSKIREELLSCVHKAVDAGLIRMSAGNLSRRISDGNVAITPTTIQYDRLKAEEIAIVDLDGNHVDGPCKASSETPMHTTIFRHLPSVGAIVHTHSPFAMTFAAVGKEIPIINLEAMMCGGPIPVAAWASPGSVAGGQVTVELFQARPRLKVALLQNHGVVAIGADLNEAFDNAYNAEIAAQVYYQALQVGEPIVLTEEQLQEIYEIYGF